MAAEHDQNPPCIPNSTSSYFLSHHLLFSSSSSCANWVQCLLLLLLLQCLFAYISQRNKPFINWPLLGGVPPFLLNIHRLHDWLADCLRSAGGTVVANDISLISSPGMIITCNPQNIKYILRSNFNNFPRGEDYREIFDVFGEGILNTDGDAWLKQRKIAVSHLQAKQFRSSSAVNTRDLILAKLIPVFNGFAFSGEAFDFQDVILRFTFDNICKIVFGTDYNCLADQDGNLMHGDHPFATAIDTLTEVIIYRHALPPWIRNLARRFKLGMERKAGKAVAVVHRFIHQSIALRRKQLALIITNKDQLDDHILAHDLVDDHQDLLGRYVVQFPNEEDKVFLRDTCLNMLVAGRDTTGVGLSWFFWMLWKNPRVKTKILEELNTIVMINNSKYCKSDANNNYFEPEDLSLMVYLQASVYETLRLYPSVPLVHRGVNVKDTLPDGTVVKPHMVIIYSIYSVGRMEWVWGKDCMEFRPERWIDDEGKLKHDFNSFQFLAFNGGPRTCVGKDMSITTMKLLAAELLMNFDFEVLNEERILPKASMILSMKEGLLVRATKKMHL